MQYSTINKNPAIPPHHMPRKLHRRASLVAACLLLAAGPAAARAPPAPKGPSSEKLRVVIIPGVLILKPDHMLWVGGSFGGGFKFPSALLPAEKLPPGQGLTCFPLSQTISPGGRRSTRV
jgi:hypothetical protein